MTVYPVTVTDLFGNTEGFGGANQYPYTYQVGTILNSGFRVHDAATESWQWGGSIVQGFNIHPSYIAQHRFPATLTTGILVHDALLRAYKILLSQGVAVHQAQQIAWEIQLLQNALFEGNPSAAAHYHKTVAVGILLHDALAWYWGRTLTQGLAIHPALSQQWQWVRQLAQGLAFHDAQTHYVLFQFVVNQNFAMHDMQLLKALYKGDPLSDTIYMSVAYVDPGGGVTTWVMNTRTQAVTEYQNYNFNSFCRMGHQFLGANSEGLWLLNGPTDGGSPIPTQVKSGKMDLGGAKFTSFKAIYLGLRVKDGAEDFFLKITVPGAAASTAQPGPVGTFTYPPELTTPSIAAPNDGNFREYIYQLQPQDMMSTKVFLGKGLSSRYFTWELITSGADFDFDAIEFVPIIRQRRV